MLIDQIKQRMFQAIKAGEVLAVSVHGSAAALGSQLREACKTAAYAP